MIADCGRGGDVGGLLRYLYGPGRANEHSDPRLVASWLGDDPDVLARLEPDGEGVRRRDCAGLAAQLRYAVDAFGGPQQYVWHVPIALAADEGALTDAQWAVAARRVLDRTGVARAGDPAACRWVVVHHGRSAGGNDHVHLVATLVRQDGRTERAWNDWPRSRAAVAEVEAELGLRPTPGRDRTADRAATRAEVAKAVRTGGAEPVRSWLRREVRTAVAMSADRADFTARLDAAGVRVRWRESATAPGQLTGYSVGRTADVTASGEQVWFGGSKLAPDLALPRLEARWAETAGGHAGPPRATGRAGRAAVAAAERPRVPTPRRPLTPQERAALLVRTARALERAADELTGSDGRPAAGLAWTARQQARAVSAAEVASALGRVVEGPGGGPISAAAGHLARAARRPDGRRPQMRHHVHGLRDIATGLALLGTVAPGEAGAVLTITAHLLRIADALDRLGRPQAGEGAQQLRAWEQAARAAGPPVAPGADPAGVRSRAAAEGAPAPAVPSRAPATSGRRTRTPATGSPSPHRRRRG